MQNIDLPQLTKELNALAEVFERRVLTEAAARVWFDTLRDFPTEQVLSVIIAWPKTHTKFPAPADVWKVMNELVIERRERIAERERKEPAFYPGVGGAKAEEFIRKMRATLGMPKWGPLEHWQRVFETQPKGSIGYRYAEEVLRSKGRIFDREPGQDDDEGKAVNF